MVVRVSLEQMCCPEPESACARLEQLCRSLFREGQARGEIRADMDTHAAFGVLGAVFVGALLWWVGPPHGRPDPVAREVSLPDAVRHQLGLVFDGLRVRGLPARAAEARAMPAR
jgi:hypothetical protein